MSQITTGFRALLSNPLIYEFSQRVMGASKSRERFVSEFVEPYLVENVLDIGCGPANILAYMPGVDYYGYDISESYITKARNYFGDKGKFFAKHLTYEDVDSMPKFDLVLLTGVLHHLDDEAAIDVLSMAYKSLKSNGRLITTDPCLVDGQNPIARYLIEHDRGQNVKVEIGYKKLAKKAFNNVEISIRHIRWVPYTLCYMICTKD